MNKTRYWIVVLVIAFTAYLPIVGHEKMAGATSTPAAVTPQLVASVNIYSAKLVSQNGNTFTVNFDIYNRIGSQSGIKYAAALVDKSGATVDENVYSDVVVLGQDQTVHKTITYTPATSLAAGKYKLWIISENESGLSLGLNTVGDVTIVSNPGTPNIQILTDTCSLTVGKNTKTKYTLDQGVDIGNTESLTASCSVFSTFKGTNSFTPAFETRARNIFGPKVADAGGATSSISIKQGTSTISLVLPKALNPQAYDVLLTLAANAGAVTSNTVDFHYVIRGISGTVQNAVFDKASYVAGDTANLKILISDPADTFSGSRAGSSTPIVNKIVNVTITAKDGTACGSISQSLYSKDGDLLNLKIPITADCSNPSANVTFSAAPVGGTQQVLDSKTFTTPPEVKNPSGYNNISTKNIIIIIICLILLAIIVSIYEKFHKKA